MKFAIQYFYTSWPIFGGKDGCNSDLFIEEQYANY
jgi:hypothetical protein